MAMDIFYDTHYIEKLTCQKNSNNLLLNKQEKQII